MNKCIRRNIEQVRLSLCLVLFQNHSDTSLFIEPSISASEKHGVCSLKHAVAAAGRVSKHTQTCACFRVNVYLCKTIVFTTSKNIFRVDVFKSINECVILAHGS
ncbi:unnamed protein product [Vicia faba]|uniref:Secreted protein n=1 Tax=Vicia faba TaxID=3906 RepID=A0AAV0ZML9_VICFA|nr:unnamed protein product [Vicia faba]